MASILMDIVQMDRQLFDLLNNDMGVVWDNVFWIFSEKLVWVPLYLAILYMIYRKVGLRDMIVAMVVIVLMTVVCDHIGNFFKGNFSRFRPTHDPLVGSLVHTVNGYRGGLYGTVSSHASISFSIAMFSLLLLKNKWYSYVIIVWAALVAFSRIYLGVHYPKDITYGTVLGLTAGVVFYKGYLALLKTKFISKFKK